MAELGGDLFSILPRQAIGRGTFRSRWVMYGAGPALAIVAALIAVQRRDV
jgi:hypothetical protein